MAGKKQGCPAQRRERERDRERGRETGAEEEMDVPMRRYVYPSAVQEDAAQARRVRERSEERLLLEQLVQAACCRNQLLTDLLAAVNGLTATLLAVSRPETEGRH